MKLIKVGNHIMNLDQLTDAEYIPPENSETGDVGLTLWFGDNCWVEIYGNEAEGMWLYLSHGIKTVPCQPPRGAA